MFRDFSSFEIEDFAFDESFQKWVMEDNADHRDFWQRYMDEHPHQIDKMLAARELVLELAERKSLNNHEEMVEDVWKNVRKRVYGLSIRPEKFRLLPAAAAVILLLAATAVAATAVFLWTRPVSTADNRSYESGKKAAAASWIKKINREARAVKVVLADGSTIRLDKNSRITYPEHFGDKRIVYLTGEAFFDVRKDPKHPFIIFANNTVIKVLGTSFRVSAHQESPKVVVAVKSGKVSVFARKDFEKERENPQLSGLVLMANQQAEFSREQETFSKTLVPDPLLLGTVSKAEFDFDGTPLPLVFETLQKAYGVEILFDRDLVRDRVLKVSLEDETLFEKMDIICRTMGLTYHVVDARIIIESQ